MMTFVLRIVGLTLAVHIAASSASSRIVKNSTYPFRNPNLTIAARVENLISLLTVEEKAQLIGKVRHCRLDD